MTEFSGHRADAAAKADNVSVFDHDAYVRCMRTHVNVENERLVRDSVSMIDGKTLGEHLSALKAQSGYSLDTIASGAGYAGRSSIQRYFNPTYDAPYLPRELAEKLAEGLAPKVDPAAVLVLTGDAVTNARPVKFEGASSVELPRDVPIYGTALGAPQDFDGQAIEQTMLNTGEVIGYLRRPTVINGQKNVYGLYIQGSSMAPRYEEGETAFVSGGGRPPRIGDDVVVYLREDEDEERAAAVLIKRLVRRTSEYTELEQFNPPMSFRIETARVLRIDRVIPWSELLS